MQAVILAGGFGTRLKNVINDIPKPMAPIRNVPFLSYILNQLNRQGFTKVVLAVGYLHEKIVSFYGDKFKNIELVYSIENEPLGTGGCVKKAFDLLNDEYVYVINGDTMFDISFEDIKNPINALIVCKYMNNASRYGRIMYKDGIITQFLEKGYDGQGYINGGIYVFRRNVFNQFTLPEKFSMEKDFFEKYLNQLEISVYLSDGYFIDIGIPEDYERAQVELYE